MNVNKVLLGILIGAVVLTVISFLLPKRYVAQGKLLFHRNPVEIPALVFEESKNRWAWVRDGYALQSLATSDTAQKLCEKGSKLEAVFSSGDDFTLAIEARSTSALGAQKCVAQVMDLLKVHAETFRLDQLKSAAEALKATKFREEAIASFKLEESFSKSRVAVLKIPELPECARWPNRLLFAVLGGFLGGALAWMALCCKRTA